MLPRCVWHGSRMAIDLARRNTNKIVCRNHGNVVTQPSIHDGLPHIFQLDGVNLSTDGTEIYLANMARSIRTAVAFAEDELANLG